MESEPPFSIFRVFHIYWHFLALSTTDTAYTFGKECHVMVTCLFHSTLAGATPGLHSHLTDTRFPQMDRLR